MAVRKKDTASGFETFCAESKKKAAAQHLTFVHVEVEQIAGHRKAKKPQKPKKPKPDPLPDSETLESQREGSQPPNARREQVHAAQKRHRRRKAEYTSSLEAEIVQLKYHDALVSADSHRIATQNAAIREYLVSNGFLSTDEQAASSSNVPAEPYNLDESYQDTHDDRIDPNLQTPYESNMSSGSDSEPSQSSTRNQSNVLILDPPTDSSSRSKIEECRELLLKDIYPFEDDERADRGAWEALANLIIHER